MLFILSASPIGPLQMAVSIIGIVLIIFGAYFSTGLLARRAGNIQKGRAIKVLDRVMVSKDRMFLLVEVANRVYLVGMTNNSVERIDTFDISEIDIPDSSPAAFSLIKRKNDDSDRAGGLMDRFSDILSKSRNVDIEIVDDKPEFAAEEDDIDVVYRKIYERKREREADNEGKKSDK